MSDREREVQDEEAEAWWRDVNAFTLWSAAQRGESVIEAAKELIRTGVPRDEVVRDLETLLAQAKAMVALIERACDVYPSVKKPTGFVHYDEEQVCSSGHWLVGWLDKCGQVWCSACEAWCSPRQG